MLWNKDEDDHIEELFRLAALNSIDTDEVDWVSQLDQLRDSDWFRISAEDSPLKGYTGKPENSLHMRPKSPTPRTESNG